MMPREGRRGRRRKDSVASPRLSPSEVEVVTTVRKVKWKITG